MSGRKQVSFSDTLIIRSFGEDLVHSDKVSIKVSENHDNPVLIVGGKEDHRCPR